MLKYQGMDLEVENWEEFKHDLLMNIGRNLAREVQKQVEKAKIYDEGNFRDKVVLDQYIKVDGDTVTLVAPVPYAIYLEYGTAGTMKGVTDTIEGAYARGVNPNRKMPVKKEGGEWKLLFEDWAKRHGFPKKSHFALAKHIQKYGMKAYAPYRRVFYNKTILRRAINDAQYGMFNI